jgi:hypothetical protein
MIPKIMIRYFWNLSKRENLPKKLKMRNYLLKILEIRKKIIIIMK